jgi:c-di-GMP-binding flagellar brake protein YcgR
MIERRAYRRIRYTEPVEFERHDPSILIGSVATDISEGGLRLNIPDFIPLHAEVNVQVSLKDKGFVNCPAKVMWLEKHPYSDRYFVGVKFVDENYRADDRQKVRSFVSLTK